jgi:hypothetical protein
VDVLVACQLSYAAAGAVDFALIFVAHYGLPKKYTDPGDASHAVDMLREVLGKVRALCSMLHAPSLILYVAS